jgi:hypothetical protein
MRNDELRFVHGPLARRRIFGLGGRRGSRRGRPWGRLALVAFLAVGATGLAWIALGEGVGGAWSAIEAPWSGPAEDDALPVPENAAPASAEPLPTASAYDGSSRPLPLPPLPPGR